MNGYVLGLDGGGTKVLAQIADANGVVVGSGSAGPCNIAWGALPEAVASATAASAIALAEAGLQWSDLKSVCAAVAGTSFVQRLAGFRLALELQIPSAAIIVEPDYTAAFTGATGGQPGMIVIAGTGSVAYGENPAGEVQKAGGYGYLIDDSGSGYGVGHAAIAAVLRAHDGLEPVTSLRGRILKALGCSDITEIVPLVYGGNLATATIASLSQVVSAAVHEDNDKVAHAILMRAGGALAQLANAVSVTLFPSGNVAFQVSQIGSLWLSDAPLTDVFIRSLHRFAPNAVLVPPQHPPVYGAVLRALRTFPHD